MGSSPAPFSDIGKKAKGTYVIYFPCASEMRILTCFFSVSLIDFLSIGGFASIFVFHVTHKEHVLPVLKISHES